MHEALAALVLDKSALDRLAQNPRAEELQVALAQMVKQERGNDLDSLFG